MTKSILFVVEGQRTEPRFLRRLVGLTRTYEDYEVFSYRTNIHHLLDGMFVDGKLDTDLDFMLRSIAAGGDDDKSWMNALCMGHLHTVQDSTLIRGASTGDLSVVRMVLPLGPFEKNVIRKTGITSL